MPIAHMPKGFMIVSRALLDHPVVGIGSGHTAHWLDLLARASYVDGHNGLNRGELCVGRKQLAESWGISEKSVRCFLDKLRVQNMLIFGAKNPAEKGQKRGRPSNVYTIVNYEKYQDVVTEGAKIEAKKTEKKGHSKIHKKNIYPNGYVVSVPEIDPCEPPLPCTPEADVANKITPAPVQPQPPIQAQALAPAPAAAPDEFMQAIDAWNAMARKVGLPACRALTDDRKKKLRARLKEHGLDAWEAAVNTVPKSTFLLGKTKGNREGWRANFDFMVRPETINKIQEGNYGISSPSAKITRTTATPWSGYDDPDFHG